MFCLVFSFFVFLVFFSIFDSRFFSLLLLVILLCRLVSLEWVLSSLCSGLICLIMVLGLKFFSEWNFRLMLKWLLFFVSVFGIWNVVCGFMFFIILLKLLWLMLMNLWLCSLGCCILDWFDRLVIMFIMNGSFFVLIVLLILMLYVSCICGGCIFCRCFCMFFFLVIMFF